jgi:hypothetical protein
LKLRFHLAPVVVFATVAGCPCQRAATGDAVIVARIALIGDPTIDCIWLSVRSADDSTVLTEVELTPTPPDTGYQVAIYQGNLPATIYLQAFGTLGIGCSSSQQVVSAPIASSPLQKAFVAGQVEYADLDLEEGVAGGDGGIDSGNRPDSSLDGGRDASVGDGGEDSGSSDAATDSGTRPDAGPGADAGADSGVDAGVDAGADAGPDAGSGMADGGPTAILKGVQSGTITSMATGSVTATLNSAVNVNHAFLIFNIASDSAVPPDSYLLGDITSGTTVQFTRATSTTTPPPIDIQWYVVEFSSGVNVQRGDNVMENATTIDVTINSVASTSQAFVLMSKIPGPTDQNFDDNDPVIAQVTSPTNVEFRVAAFQANMVISWQVVEFIYPGDINVQTGSTQLTGATLSSTITLGTAVDLTKTFALCSFNTTEAVADNQVGARLVRAVLTDSKTVTVDRSITGTPAQDVTEVFCQAVQLTNSVVQGASENFPSGTGQQTVSLSPSVDVSRSVAFASVQPAGGQSFGRSPYNLADSIGVASVTVALSSSQVTMTRNNTADQCDVGWFVVQFGN